MSSPYPNKMMTSHVKGDPDARKRLKAQKDQRARKQNDKDK